MIDANWEKPPWRRVKAATLACCMGESTGHFPNTQVKVMYDLDHLYVIYRVEDRYVRAVAPGHQSQVCLDSCVEFFFTPGTDISDGYFNLEANCGGALFFHHQIARGVETMQVAASDLDQIEVAHSLPFRVAEEIQEPTTWTLEYRLPFAILERYARLTRPCLGAVWKANFYKCADHTSHPHWLTWSYIDRPRPDFHRPEYFGDLVF